MMTTTGWPLWLLLGLGTLGFWGTVAYAAGSLFHRSDPAARDTADPLATLDERLARGQLSIEEYVQQRRHLTDGH
ncbi:hypothetical protein N864_23525 [Intrasporangium chromatireducens Q5-1]|uniref:SHOCT domain-containing protein n=1 Tax=Intrasporangium chromatireducens Q5-1 TaxID=584657 RepID=W9GNP1_9MICO|nr:SHOCT domain-containing protein [Intrasporangium chromatireducens]EWT07740.1 hypothetical protein N864_23525 [Intrasporangium chromatireducens Q5-1]